MFRKQWVIIICPLFCQFRMNCCKIVESHKHLVTRTVWTSGSVNSILDNGFPLVSTFSSPPDLFMRTGRYIHRRYNVILAPFQNKLRVFYRKYSCHYPSPSSELLDFSFLPTGRRPKVLTIAAYTYPHVFPYTNCH